jgi:site-specific recombinase XerD
MADLQQLASYLKDNAITGEQLIPWLCAVFLAELHQQELKKSSIVRKLAAMRSFFAFLPQKKLAPG